MRSLPVLGGWIARGAVAGGAVAMLLLGIGIGGAAARGGAPVPVRQIRSVPVGVKAVALTFDDGPNPTYTPQVLALLREYGAKATFFVIGRELVRYPELARQEVQAGMELGNHGMNHLTLKGLDATAVEADALPVERMITALTGNRPTLYRLPKGVGDSRSLRTLADMGYTVVYWSVDTHDYLPRTAASIAAQVLKQVQPGSIVIFHDGGGNRQATVDALKLILPELKARGYQMVTVSQLLELAAGGATTPSRPSAAS